MATTQLTAAPTPTGIRHTEPDTQAYFGEDATADPGAARGTLYITEDAVTWWSPSSLSGFTVPYPSIVLHAITRDLSTFGLPAIYCQLERPGQDEDEPADELRLAPSDPANLSAIFTALSDCQALHPDPASQSDEDGMDEMGMMGMGGAVEGDEVDGMYDDANDERYGNGGGAGNVDVDGDGDGDGMVQSVGAGYLAQLGFGLGEMAMGGGEALTPEGEATMARLNGLLITDQMFPPPSSGNVDRNGNGHIDADADMFEDADEPGN